MFFVFTVISVVGCRGGDRQEGRKGGWWICGGGRWSGLKNSVYLLKNYAKMNPFAV